VKHCAVALRLHCSPFPLGGLHLATSRERIGMIDLSYGPMQTFTVSYGQAVQ
jgi:hypothetical protein